MGQKGNHGLDNRLVTGEEQAAELDELPQKLERSIELRDTLSNIQN